MGKKHATVNGKKVELTEGETVLSLYKRVEPTMPIAVIRLNGRILSKREWESTRLKDGDEMVIVEMIAGG